MSELLSKIDKDLIDLEERLLLELGRLRKLDLKDTYAEIDPDLKSELKHVYSALVEALESTVSTKNLSLKSNEQLWIEDRMRAIRNLLVHKLPAAFLKLSHNEHMRYKPEPHESARHAASREIAILSEQVILHVRDGQSIAEIVKDRAEFASYDLSRGHASELAPPERKIAQTPEEIRRKLAGKAGQSGPSSFAARDLSSSQSIISQGPVRNPKARGDIAQTPEAIRKKLAERQAQASGKASFASKDIESESDRYPDKSREDKKSDEPAGKASFEARDLTKPRS